MPLKPDAPFPKTQGDNIRSKDWNDVVNELIRLDNEVANRSVDRINGPLTIAGALAVGSAKAPPSGIQVKSLLRIDEGPTGQGAWCNFGSNAYFDGAWKQVDPTKAGVNLHMNADGDGQEFRFMRLDPNGQNPRNVATIGSSGVQVNTGGVHMNDLDIRLRGDPNHGLGWYGGSKSFAGTAPDGPVLYGWLGGALGTTTGGLKTAFSWNANGDVKITGHLGTMNQDPKPRTKGWGGGVHTWDVEAEGTIWARNGSQSGARDLAENYESDLPLEQGDVVRMDTERDRIIPCENPNDDLLMGVISTQPGLLLNASSPAEPPPTDKKMFPVALSGCIPCKVTDENGPIRRGDLLTSSSTPGHAMKAAPINVDGHKFYRPGTIIGKALNPLHERTGVIEVFVSLR